MDSTRGCAVGVFRLLDAWLPRREATEELPHVCKIASLFEPELYTSQAVKAHQLEGLHKSTDACEQVPTRQHNTADFETGDLVVIGKGNGYEGSAAVVCEITPLNCRVAVLDPSRSFKVAEQHVASSILRCIHGEWRIGSRHIIRGLQSSNMKRLNGLAACVREHRRYGHPCFVPKPEGDTKLRLCVRWENPAENANGALLLEPHFLSPDKSDTDNTLLTAKRRMAQPGVLKSSMARPSGFISAIDEIEPTVCHVSNVESLTAPSPNCSGTFLGALSWLVGARTRHVEEEFPTVIRLSSVLAAEPPREQLSWLLPISEGSDAEVLSEGTDRLQGITEHLEQGDLVILDQRLQRYALCPAVVKGVDASGCTVAVLDESRSIFKGECQASLSDVALVHSEWRLGKRVVLQGLQSSHMTHLNGLSAVICPHKRHGHPCFVQKPSSPNTGEWLTLCIRFDDPGKSSMHAVLLEPRFLAPDCRPHLSPRLECFTPSSTPSVARSHSLADRSAYHKQLSGQGRRPWSTSYPRVPKQPTAPSIQASSSTPGSLMRQFSSPSMISGDSRASFADLLGEDDVVKEIKELKESLKSLTKDQGR